jgi:hypothetical protein
MGLIVAKILDILLNIIGGLIMKPLTRLWHSIWAGHLQKSVRNEECSLQAVTPSEGLPYISLKWRLNNGSETDVEIKRLYGALYISDRRLACFDVHNPIETQFIGNKQQYIRIQRTLLNKGKLSGIEIIFYPSIEFWLSVRKPFSLSVTIEGATEIHSHGLNITVPLVKDGLPIENIDTAVLRYHGVLTDRLNVVTSLRGSN